MTQAAALVRSNDNLDRMRALVGVLRERGSGGLREVLGPVLAERDRALAGEISAAAAAILRDYDHLLLTALSMRYDALDCAVRDTMFAVAEIDGEGVISYANKALTAMLPNAVGSDFAALFGPRAQHVRQTLSSGARETLRLDLCSANEVSVHLRGEIGPLADEQDRPGAYALLLGLEGELARLNALPDGVVRIDPNGNIADVNPRAEEILGLAADEMRGRPAASLFMQPGSPGTPLPVAEWLAATQGRKVRAEVPDVRRNRTTPVRLAVTPYFDSAQSRAGVLLTIFPMGRELVRRDLQKALSDPDTGPECLVRRVMQAVKRIIPYDLATFGVYTDDMNYHTTMVVDPQPNWPWLTAWFPLNEQSKQFLHGPRTWGEDLQQDAAALAPHLKDDPVMQRVVEAEMKGYVTLPIGGGGERIRASLTLLSKRAKSYDGRELEVMRELGVEKALLVAEANIARRRVELARRLEQDLTSQSGYRELAETLAAGISKYLGWEYVAVFELDRAAERFRILAQHNAAGSAGLAAGYSQPFSDGLLGAALRANRPQFEPDIVPGEERTYRPAIAECRSAAALPMRVVRRRAEPAADEIEWIVKIESSQRNAFRGPNMQSLEEALGLSEGYLRQRWHNCVQASLLDTVEQALVFVDRAGKIRLTNLRANALLGGKEDQLFGATLAKFGATDRDKRLLADRGVLEQQRVMLHVADDVTAPALATHRALRDDYGHWLWLLTDLREQEVQKDWKYLEQTVDEVAQNTRLPLMIAGDLVLSAAEQLDGEQAEKLKSAARQLAKADITYERLVSTLAARREPDWPQQLFDALDVLRQSVFELPEEDLAWCDQASLQSESKPFYVAGWPDQLKFAFRSVIAHLLVNRPYEAKVGIALDRADDRLKVVLSVPTGATRAPVQARDRIGAAQQRARDAASLASEAIELAVRRQGGSFAGDSSRQGVLAFRFELPAA